jgi:hypothetical protein
MGKNVKSSYSKKEYVFPSGRIDQIQGYEHFALDELIINEKIEESDIITGCKNVPEIWYHEMVKIIDIMLIFLFHLKIDVLK